MTKWASKIKNGGYKFKKKCPRCRLESYVSYDARVCPYCGQSGLIRVRKQKEKRLIIMRGLPGSGKTILAEKLVGTGIIHSTDNYLIGMENISLIKIILLDIII